MAFDDLLHTQVEAALPEVGEARALARELATLASDTEDVINARVTAQRELDVAEVALTGTGMALNLNNGTLAGGFNGVSSTSSSAQGLALQNISVGGTFGFGGTSISGSTTQGLLVSNSPANLDFGATLVNLAGGTDAISLQSSSAGGTRSFSSVTA